MYFESHAHYDDRKFKNDRDKLLDILPALGIDHCINIGADMRSSKISIALANKYPYIYAAVGVHPHNAKEMTDEDIDRLTEMTKHKKVVAIGEIGLDFHYDNSPRDIQREYFTKQLEICEKTGLPVVIHSREAEQETFDIIKESKVRRGVIHCYAGSVEMAELYVNLGFYLGIGGVITYHSAKNLKEVVLNTPLESLLLETDSPYLSPEPNRGTRNNSQNLKYICEQIGKIKQISHEEVAEKTAENGRTLFDIK